MTSNPVEPLARADFLRLASACGLRLSPTDLFQLERHKLLCALEGGDGVDTDGTYYCTLHLYVLATYLDGVRSYRHPWASISGEREHDEIELDELGARCRELDEVVSGLTQRMRSGGENVASVPSQVIAQLARDVERYAHGIDPFGPLSGIVDMMRADVVEKLRGAGRLYGELRRLAAGLAVVAEQLAGLGEEQTFEGLHLAERAPGEVAAIDEVEEKSTREMVGIGVAAEAGVVKGRVTRVSEPPTIAISIDEVPVDDVRRTQLIERLEGAEAGVYEAGAEPLVFDVLEKAVSKASVLQEAVEETLEELAAESVDPIEAALAVARSDSEEKWEAGEHGFGREESVTSRTMDLSARLERLRRQDRQVAEEPVEQVENEQVAQVSTAEGLDHALSDALDGAFADVLDGALDGMLDGALSDALDAEVGGDESDEVLLENELLEEPLLEKEESDAVLLENELLEEPLLEKEESDAVLLENEFLEEDFAAGDEGLALEDSEVLEKGPTYAGEELAEKIAELNRLREQYLAARAWSQLVDLYEDGIGLFVDSNERQQVYLVLATLYEVKLGEKGRAMDAFIRAFSEVGTETGTSKALAGMMRLGPDPEVYQGYVTSLEEQLAGELEEEERRYLQRFHALALFGAGEYQRAFLLYASMLAEDPDAHVNPQSLDDLELLGAEVDVEEVLDFYHDILEQNVRPEVRQWVQQRVEAL